MKLIYMECTIQYMQTNTDQRVIENLMSSGVVKVIDGTRPYLVTEIL